jgi:lysozyme
VQVNEAGLKLIKKFEGLRLRAYRCPAGVWTIGYGHTKTAKRGQVITEAEADRLLREDLHVFERGVLDALGGAPTTENQFSAMVSLAFNIGLGAFRRSKVLALHKAGKTAEAARAFANWRKAGGKVLPGLVRRRAAEAKLYLTPDSEKAQPGGSQAGQHPSSPV